MFYFYYYILKYVGCIFYALAFFMLCFQVCCKCSPIMVLYIFLFFFDELYECVCVCVFNAYIINVCLITTVNN